MKIAMAQMSMADEIEKNEAKILSFCDQAKDCDILFFPEIQYSPFFPQYPGRNADRYSFQPDAPQIRRLCEKAREHHLCISPNVYLKDGENYYDASLWIDQDGEIQSISKMVHICNAELFYEKDYYTPSDDGFKVIDTGFGKVGIVICFDRHFPESIRSCTRMGAELVLIPTANHKAEPMELFEWEIRVQAMQNQVFVAMCNRVGKEDRMVFAGESLVISPDGSRLLKSGEKEELLIQEIDLAESGLWREKRPYLSLRRPEMYL